jgi:hypothetical protein
MLENDKKTTITCVSISLVRGHKSAIVLTVTERKLS